jgi:hypothetical protein
MTEIDVTAFLATECMRDYSASIAELGPSAGADTWRASRDAASDWNFLPDDDTLEEFRAFIRSSGGWSDDEIRAMSDAHLRALCLQWIAGDARECFNDGPIDWAHYESMVNSGRISGRFYRADDGAIFWSMAQ